MLILVVGILAVLMLMATAVALLSRVELKTSRNYEIQQALEQLVEATRTYAICILEQDKFGSNGIPYDYEVLAAAGGPTSDIYPCGRTYAQLVGDDEGFDSYQNEEWLPGSESWRLFPGDYLNPQWQSGPEVPGSAARSNRTAEFFLQFIDLGGACVDLNCAGNIRGAGETHAQNQGLAAPELNLDAVIAALGGVPAVCARAVVKARYGDDDAPGLAGADDGNPLGPFGGFVPALDVNLDGAIDAASVIDGAPFSY